VHRITQRLRPPADTPLYESGSLEEVLWRGAEADIAHRADTDGASVNWLMVAEAQRFPALAAMVACKRRPAEVVGQIAAALEREARADALAIEPPAFAAEQFLQPVVTLPQAVPSASAHCPQHYGSPSPLKSPSARSTDCFRLRRSSRTIRQIAFGSTPS
jgi:hypothetical protein